jgi:uncharacterized membrane protein
MPLILENLSWMSFNIFLAVLPVLFVYFFRTVKNPFFKLLAGSLWIAFLPNTIYLLLDLIHLPSDLIEASSIERIVVMFMYVILVALGLLTYFFAFRPIELLFPHSIKQKRSLRLGLLILCNAIVGFALVLGRVERVNSWDLVVNPKFVFTSSVHVLTSSQLLLLFVFFSLMSTVSYLFMKEFLLLPAITPSRKSKKRKK